MNRRVVIPAVLAIALFGCYGEDKRLSGPYILRNAYIEGHTYLAHELDGGGSIGRVSGSVVAAGADWRHVIVKRHPDENPSATEYFIIDRKLDGPHKDPSASVVGPLDYDRYLAMRRAMRVSPALDFSFEH